MKLIVNSNGKKIEMPKADFDKFSSDQKRNYTIVDPKDTPAPKDQVANNLLETGKAAETGKKPEGEKK